MGTKKRAPEAFSFQPFENLKDIIEHKRIAVAVKPAAEEKFANDGDDELFAAAMKEVREIKEFRQIVVCPKKVAPRFRHNPPGHDALQVLKDVTSGHVAMNLPDTQEYVEWCNPVYWPVRNGSIAGKLHRGFFSVQDCLDLHGFFVAQAEAETELFLKEAIGKGLRCIKIIHGRGLRSPEGPVLKSALIGWLTYRYRKNVIAFASARQCDGGLGALYILLK
ncbi:MAG TPA: Smr/MutS family protein [Dissulfurispiraceae bacterium]|nr:Smr/MutS family protein [Dissulfurispiraceae bacterium]